jgi:putative ABC transport system ATP-binding protein
VIYLRNIQLTLNKNTALEKRVLSDLNLHIPKGQFVIVMGCNGAGKSSLFKVLTKQFIPEKGQMQINCPYSFSTVQVLQDPIKATVSEFTIEENLNMAYKRGRGLSMHNLKKRREKFQQLLEKAGLNLKLDTHVHALSGGQRQFISLLMAFISQSPIVLLDEITASLDPQKASFVMNLIAQESLQEEKTILVITHNIAHALAYGERLLIMDQGRIIADYIGGKKSQLTHNHIASYINQLS